MWRMHVPRLLERCSPAQAAAWGGPLTHTTDLLLPQQVESVAAAILSDVSGIARHPYGNYAAHLDPEMAHGCRCAEVIRAQCAAC